MEIMVLLVLAFVVAPIVLSIVALVKASDAARNTDELRCSVNQLLSKSVPRAESRPAEPAPKESKPSAVRIMPPPLVQPEPMPPRPQETPISRPTSLEPEREKDMEVVLGGKVASFVGVAALVVGIVFFVGYAIQHDWIGPAMRIVLGLVAGGILVGLGHLTEIRGRNLTILARALTGGGAALFYFCVFAAYGIYHLIGAISAGAGMAVSAAAALGLALAYDSQAIAVLGLSGAFIAPLLIGGEFDRGLFPLAFIAVVNLPVLIAGIKRGWQVLYNLAFAFTVLFVATWLDRTLPTRESWLWVTGLCFVVVYFAEFVALGLVKLTRERQVAGRTLDVIRLLLCSLALLGALYWILTVTEWGRWKGAAFLLAALVHIGLAKIGWRWLPEFRDENLVFLVGALTFASLALPAQLDGVWVSLGWAVEGVVVCWFAIRIGSRLLQAGAVALGALGLGKSLLFDVTLYDVPPRLFLNGRFTVGLLSALSLGVQSWLHGRPGAHRDTEVDIPWRDALACVAILSVLAAIFADAFYILADNTPWSCLLTTIVLLMAGIIATRAERGRPNGWIWTLGVILIVGAPMKLLLFDLAYSWSDYAGAYPVFRNVVIWLQILVLSAVVAYVGFLSQSEKPGSADRVTIGHLINVAALVGIVVLITMEIERGKGSWSQSMITIWWAVCALALAVTGLIRQRRYLRIFALILFAVTIGKVFLVDLSGLSGLHRIAAFIGVGLFLLLLSYAYQRIAPWLGKKSAEPPENKRDAS